MAATREIDTVYRWRQGEDLGDEEPVHESWIENGRRQTAGDDEMLFYAVLTRPIRQYLWEKDPRTSELVEGPLSDRMAFETLYVTSDGRFAVVQVWESANQTELTHPTDEFCSVIADSPDEAGVVSSDEKQESYRQFIAHHYEIES